MPFIDPDPIRWLDRVIGNGHCVLLLQLGDGARAPHTSHWRVGAKVVGNEDLKPGTAIATFGPAGNYTNSTDGHSHAAIFCGHAGGGLCVIDQWVGQPVHSRIIRDKAGRGPGADDASRYSVIELA